jgi:hypothetical protein
MATEVITTNAIKGGEFLIRETQANEIFIPEEFNEEQLMIKQQCVDFLKKEIYPRLDEIDSMKRLERKVGFLNMELQDIKNNKGTMTLQVKSVEHLQTWIKKSASI